MLPIQSADGSDLLLALEAVRAHRLAFWDAMLWASAQRAGIRQILTEDFQDGFVLRDVLSFCCLAQVSKLTGGIAPTASIEA